jgi:hypothetical protein
VKNLVQDVQTSTGEDDVTFCGASGAQFTPADFFKDAGTIIAVCLALGLLMQILLG